MLVALNVIFIVSYLIEIVTRRRTFMLLPKIVYKHKYTLTLPFSLCHLQFSVAPAMLSEQEKQLGYGAWLLSWLFPARTLLTDDAGLGSEDIYHVRKRTSVKEPGKFACHYPYDIRSRPWEEIVGNGWVGWALVSCQTALRDRCGRACAEHLDKFRCSF